MLGVGQVVGDLGQVFLGRSLPGQCPAVTLRLIASPIAHSRSIGSDQDGLFGAEGNTAHSSTADPTS